MTLLPDCPRCRRPCTDADTICPCGHDLVKERAFMERLMQPGAGAPVLPLSILRKLGDADRTSIVQAISHARQSYKTEPPAPARRDSSRGLRLQLLAQDTFTPDALGYVLRDGVHATPMPDGVTPEMHVRAIWFVRAGEIGTFEEVEPEQ